MFTSFRLKILAAFLTLLIVILGATLGIVSRVQTRRAETDVRTQLEVTRTVFGSILDYRAKQLLTSMKLLVNDFAFKQALATHDPKTIQSAAFSLRDRIGAGAVWVTDEEGRLLADTAGMLKPGEMVSGVEVISKAMEEEAATAIVPLKGKAFQMAGVPVLAPDVVGILAASFAIDDKLAAELKRLTLTDVSFASEGTLFATTLAEGDRDALQKTPMTMGTLNLMGPAGRQFLVLPTEPGPKVVAYLQRSWDEALEPVRRQQKLLVLIGLAGILATGLIGFMLAHGVTAPVSRLVDATKRLVDGDYSTRVDVRQKDEIGQLGDAFNSMVAGLQEKEKIRSVLRKAVSKEIADELLKRGEINLGGEERQISVLFSDIRGFTTISEKLQPPELVSQLNGYFIAMSHAIETRTGVIDKFIGDAIMALFGAPLTTAQDADNAQRAALGMIAALDKHNIDRQAKGLVPWKNGIGVNTGPAVAGTMGSEDRWSYTVIGDAVNLASRLEGLTKHYGVQILVSGATRAASTAPFVYRTLDLVRVKGKNEPVEIFELIGEGVAAPGWIAPFEAGVKSYRARDFKGAKTSFEAVLAVKPGDVMSGNYLERIEPLLASVPSDWEAAHTMHEK